MQFVRLPLCFADRSRGAATGHTDRLSQCVAAFTMVSLSLTPRSQLSPLCGAWSEFSLFAPTPIKKPSREAQRVVSQNPFTLDVQAVVQSCRG